MTAKPSHDSRRPCYLRRTLTGFSPADRGSEEIARRYGVGTILRADIKKPRNARHHRLYWSMLALICDNLNGVRPETLHALITVSYTHLTLPTKRIV